MSLYPKSPKSAKRAQKSEKNRLLKAFRRGQAALAIFRDNALCTVCYFQDGKIVPFADVHHVYGRGVAAGDWREKFENLLCVCREHHPLPIKTPGGNESLAWVEAVLISANNTPISSRFLELKNTLKDDLDGIAQN